MTYKESPLYFTEYPNMHEIIPNLWLGNIDASIDYQLLEKHNISNILSILSRNSYEVSVSHHLLLQLLDGAQYSPKQLLDGVLTIFHNGFCLFDERIPL
ncbi:MAG: hypothetical protein ACXAC7_23690 [Candidatus Hodarchaeales archaeon]|jgi:hypothetical protein